MLAKLSRVNGNSKYTSTRKRIAKKLSLRSTSIQKNFIYNHGTQYDKTSKSS